ncbi:synaptic vesicle membrane protein VAT-1 homolog-like isoform X2 [Acanthaster planci]|uniref:Synaptic vesicle membrane protein VAT-1 homolog-like isoform X2 n=1 Tax=Acanthaster planci TaxID=133434 RepID=A0A8B7XMZ8_ACAPL|nr:synaptic vesicle membrane protein VAT-1 homolog-like isoform X2 [Acanthaster planci]
MATNVANTEHVSGGGTDEPDQTATDAVKGTEPEMRAVVLQSFGGVNRLKVMKKSIPVPKDGEVLVRVKACGLNFLDLMMRQGSVDDCPRTPFILGTECSGYIEALGTGVENFKVGDRVVAFQRSGTFAEAIAVPAKYVYEMPNKMTYEEGAALGVCYAAAYMMLYEVANLTKGKTVLVHSAGGGVGIAVAQLCKMVDEIKIFGTASTGKHEVIKDKFDHLFDRSACDYVEAIKKLEPKGIDIVLDCLCGEDTNKGYDLLKPMGKYVLYGIANVVTGETRSFFSYARTWWNVDSVKPGKLWDENKSMSGFQFYHYLFNQGGEERVNIVMNEIFKLHTVNILNPVIDSTYAFEEVGEAMLKMHDRKNIGKILIIPEQEPKPKPTP